MECLSGDGGDRGRLAQDEAPIPDGTGARGTEGGREVRYRVLTETETAKPLISLASL